MPDAYWNTTTGPPGPTLLYDPPYAVCVSTNAYVWTGGTAHDGITLSWNAPTIHGVGFVSVSGEDITFLCDCTIVVTVGARFFAAASSVGVVKYDLSGSMYDDAPFPNDSIDSNTVTFYTTSAGQALRHAWTTAPFRVFSGKALQVLARGDVDSGTATDQGSMVSIIRVA